jgi:synapsin
VGNQSIVEEVEVEEIWKEWADECSKVFGGLDILGLDFVHSADDDKYYILELNDTGLLLLYAV